MEERKGRKKETDGRKEDREGGRKKDILVGY